MGMFRNRRTNAQIAEDKRLAKLRTEKLAIKSFKPAIHQFIEIAIEIGVKETIARLKKIELELKVEKEMSEKPKQ